MPGLKALHPQATFATTLHMILKTSFPRNLYRYWVEMDTKQFKIKYSTYLQYSKYTKQWVNLSNISPFKFKHPLF